MADRTKYSVGIDLGTTYSCVAVCTATPKSLTKKDLQYPSDYEIRVDILANVENARTTPSVVFYHDDGTVSVGESAKNERDKKKTNPRNYLYESKRLIGQSYYDKHIQEDILRQRNWTFLVEKSGDRLGYRVKLGTSERVVMPEEVSSLILKKMKDTVSTREYPLVNPIITCPAYFDDRQRSATKVAAAKAGIANVKMMPEPTAAALTYGERLPPGTPPRTILVFDYGGGTLDVSIVTIDSGQYVVKAVTGDPYCGGQDLDRILMEKILDKITTEYPAIHLNDSSDKSLKKRLQIRQICKKAKEKLSESHSTDITIPVTEDDDFDYELHRAEFTEWCKPEFDKCIAQVRMALTEAGLPASAIDDIILVGGSSSIPYIQQMLESEVGKKPIQPVTPTEAVAYGAALQSMNLLFLQRTTRDVTPMYYGVEVQGREMSELLQKNHPYPYTASSRYSTVTTDQKDVWIRVYSSPTKITSVADGVLIGEFKLTNLPPGPPDRGNINVTFHIDEDGILRVTATELETKHDISIQILSDQGLMSHGIEQQSTIKAHHRLQLYLTSIRESFPSSSYTLPAHQTQALRAAEALLSAGEHEGTGGGSLDELDAMFVQVNTIVRSFPVELEERVNSNYIKKLETTRIGADIIHRYQSPVSSGIIDYCIMMDATGSMSSTIEGAKKFAAESIKRMKIKSGNPSEFAAACMCVRDPVDCSGDTNSFIQFTKSVDEIQRFLSAQSATGGGDECEDWAGALTTVLSLNWRARSTKLVVIVADAGAHGLGSVKDSHYAAERAKAQRVFQQLASRNIRLGFLKINSAESLRSTVQEAADIYKAAKGPMCIIDSIDVSDPTLAHDKIQKTILQQLEQTAMRLFIA